MKKYLLILTVVISILAFSGCNTGTTSATPSATLATNSATATPAPTKSATASTTPTSPAETYYAVIGFDINNMPGWTISQTDSIAKEDIVTLLCEQTKETVVLTFCDYTELAPSVEKIANDNFTTLQDLFKNDSTKKASGFGVYDIETKNGKGYYFFYTVTELNLTYSTYSYFIPIDETTYLSISYVIQNPTDQKSAFEYEFLENFQITKTTA